MPDFIVSGDASVSLPMRPLAVQMTVVGGPGSAALDVVAAEPGRTRPQSIRNDFVIVPRIETSILVGVKPSGGHAVFPNGTSVNIAVSSEGDFGGDRALINGRDVSGCSSAVIARIDLGPGAYVVTAEGAPPQRPMSELASRARTATREILARRRIEPAPDLSIAVIIDTSMSMRSAVHDHSVRAAIDVLVGVADALSVNPAVSVSLASDRMLSPVTAPADELATHTHAALGSASFGIGFSAHAATSNGPVICISDAPVSSAPGAEPISLVLAPRGLYESAARTVTLAPHSEDTWTAMLSDVIATTQTVQSLLDLLVPTIAAGHGR